MSDNKQLYIYQIDIADSTRFNGYRTETIYAYAHALSDQLLTLSTVNGGRIHFNWNLVQSFKSAPFKESHESTNRHGEADAPNNHARYRQAWA